MLGYWPYATHKKNKFWYICIFAAVALKTGYSKYEIGIYIFLFFFLKRKFGWVTCMPKQMTRLDTKKRGAQVKFKESWRALFKWTNSLEQFKHKTENMHAARWREKKKKPGNGSEEAAATLKAWWLNRCSSVSNIFLLLCNYVCFSASKHSELQVSLVFSSIFCVFFLLCLSCIFSYLSLCYFFLLLSLQFSPLFYALSFCFFPPFFYALSFCVFRLLS